MGENEKLNQSGIWGANRQSWLDSPYVDEATKQGIREMTDPAELDEAFGQDLAFGTGGMRGVMGPGSNRMNPYTVRRAILGVVNWLKKAGPEAMAKGAAIAYDTRHHSEEFARHAAVTLAEGGVTVYLTDRPTPTPVLSWVIRQNGCSTGVVLTASHNTKEFNGMKIYNDQGCQLPPQEALPLMEEIEKRPLFSPLPKADFDSLVAEGRIRLLGEDLRRMYVGTVLKFSLLDDKEAKGGLSVVYTPLNGAGNLYVREVGGYFIHVSVHLLLPEPAPAAEQRDEPVGPVGCQRVGRAWGGFVWFALVCKPHDEVAVYHARRKSPDQRQRQCEAGVAFESR